MADDVIVYWVTFNGAIYAANLASRTYVPMSSSERLGAAQRALDRAGIPHKPWSGTPASMEEFGTEVRDAEWVVSHINGNRMKPGQALEWIDEHTYRIRHITEAMLYPYQLAIHKPSGRWYAYRIGSMFHIPNRAHYDAMRKLRLIPEEGFAVQVDDTLLQTLHAEMSRVGVDPLPTTPPPPPPPPPPASAVHIVTAGDTLAKIAAANNVTVEQLLAWNPEITNPNVISVGQVIRLGK